MPKFNFATLVDYLNSPAWEQRRDAAEDLGQTGDLRALPGLKSRLTDAVGAVQYAAVVALGQIGLRNPEHGALVAKPLLDCINTPGFRFPAPVLESLGMLRVKEAVPNLIKFLRDQDATLRKLAHNSLAITTGKRRHGETVFRAEAEEAQREAAVQAWEQWWQQSRRTFQVPGKGVAAKKKRKKAPRR